MKKIIYSLMVLSVIAQANFSRSSAGVVTDSKTKLQWQDDYSDNKNSGGKAVIKYAPRKSANKYCYDLKLDGGDWRLPNINELKSIIVDKLAPTIDGEFKNTTSKNYWSSSTYASNRDYVWYVGFDDGGTNGNHYTHNNYVRCVRAGQ